MNEYGPTHNEIDDMAELTDVEREELATADAAIELAFLFHDAREGRGLTQAEAARQTGLRQQAVSRFEQPDMKLARTKLDTLRKYLTALGYKVGLSIRDAYSGALVKEISFEPSHYVSRPAPSQPLSYGYRDPYILGKMDPRNVADEQRAQIGAFSADNFIFFRGMGIGIGGGFESPYVGDDYGFNTGVGPMVNTYRNDAVSWCQGNLSSGQELSGIAMKSENPKIGKRKTAA